ncbi:hypothetical protein LguiA_011476 [Lonicera macranthoides]
MAKKPVKYCVVDAFTESAFKGNPAAVCLLEEDEERDEEWLQAVAAEFNISETCYLTPILNHSSANPRFRLRWFTPVAEVNLCGHATLAAAHFLFTSHLAKANLIEFSTLSGILTAKRIQDPRNSDSSLFHNSEARDGFLIELDFPVVPLDGDFNGGDTSAVCKGLNGASVIEIKKTSKDDLFVVLPSGKTVAEIQPQFDEIEKCAGRGMIITGSGPPGSGFDFYSRYFCPKLGVNEDPVCGSAHCVLAPYWSKKLGKSDFVAYQASPRGGIVNVHLDEKNQRVFLRGKAVAVMEGSIVA